MIGFNEINGLIDGVVRVTLASWGLDAYDEAQISKEAETPPYLFFYDGKPLITIIGVEASEDGLKFIMTTFDKDGNESKAQDYFIPA